MIAILSPAKTLKMGKSDKTQLYTEPSFLNEASELMNLLLDLSPPQMESLMKVSEELAEKNFIRHHDWNLRHERINSKQAMLAYDGAVYQGIGAGTFGDAELMFANQHVRILSGLYGALRPLDLIQPYRLEMQTKLRNPMGNNLYCFWKNRLTDYLRQELDKQRDNIILDLASKEYSTAIDLARLGARVIVPVFKDYKRGSHKIVTIYAKRARGLMTRYMIENRIIDPEQLKQFDKEGYSYNEYLSAEQEWVFTRQ